MARIVFDNIDQFLNFAREFTGRNRYAAYIVTYPNLIILRPIVTSKLDTAILEIEGNLTEEQIQQFNQAWRDKTFSVKRFEFSDETSKKVEQ